jgi:hypothetical protein
MVSSCLRAGNSWHPGLRCVLRRIVIVQDLISRLLERKPTRRLGMLNGRAGDIKRHKWFDGLDWDALEARKMEPPRLPKDDSAKRLRELMVCFNICTVIPQGH